MTISNHQNKGFEREFTVLTVVYSGTLRVRMRSLSAYFAVIFNMVDLSNLLSNQKDVSTLCCKAF